MRVLPSFGVTTLALVAIVPAVSLFSSGCGSDSASTGSSPPDATPESGTPEASRPPPVNDAAGMPDTGAVHIMASDVTVYDLSRWPTSTRR